MARRRAKALFEAGDAISLRGGDERAGRGKHAIVGVTSSTRGSGRNGRRMTANILARSRY